VSGDEALVLILSIVFGLFGWFKRIARVVGITVAPLTSDLRDWVLAAPVLALILIGLVLRFYASFDVQNDPIYLVTYLSFGMLWTRMGSSTLSGFDLIGDVAERGNKAALFAWSGAVIGSAMCFAGANVGDGPGWWCVLWAAALGTLGWFTTWSTLHALTGAADHVTIDRDPASGVRVASFLAASGVLWGRGAAGDWTSFVATFVELFAAWPVLLLLCKAIAQERLLRPTPQRLRGHWFAHGVLPALFDVPLVVVGLQLAGAVADGYARGGGK
jgi:hypothetical protein